MRIEKLFLYRIYQATVPILDGQAVRKALTGWCIARTNVWERVISDNYIL